MPTFERTLVHRHVFEAWSSFVLILNWYVSITHPKRSVGAVEGQNRREINSNNASRVLWLSLERKGDGDRVANNEVHC